MCFCVQVLRLLEDVGLPELVIQMASLAITEAVSDISSQVSVTSSQHQSAASCRDMAALVFRPRCGRESSNIIWILDTTVKPTKL